MKFGRSVTSWGGGGGGGGGRRYWMGLSREKVDRWCGGGGEAMGRARSCGGGGGEFGRGIGSEEEVERLPGGFCHIEEVERVWYIHKKWVGSGKGRVLGGGELYEKEVGEVIGANSPIIYSFHRPPTPTFSPSFSVLPTFPFVMSNPPPLHHTNSPPSTISSPHTPFTTPPPSLPPHHLPPFHHTTSLPSTTPPPSLPPHHLPPSHYTTTPPSPPHLHHSTTQSNIESPEQSHSPPSTMPFPPHSPSPLSLPPLSPLTCPSC
ncbi:hypothetical protein Pcinc_023947 [Petrolisthes cinctipes]|uniref:Uncharacterized protein n=1 Tax=Petrolisthes cinctipes TaxID=88211 RepID=A0AAE1FAW9_PETCI|nr:hypothetical protein Pcinc_023947 [Petrolisthes cinctipes]